MQYFLSLFFISGFLAFSFSSKKVEEEKPASATKQTEPTELQENLKKSFKKTLEDKGSAQKKLKAWKEKGLLRLLEKIKKERPNFSEAALTKAFLFLDQNKNQLQPEGLCLSQDNKNNRKKIRNHQCMIVADYSKSKEEKRLIYINLKTGESELFYTAHGKGSNPPQERKTAKKAVQFSNKQGSNMTSLGFYLTDFLYDSQKSTFGPGPSNGLKLDGLNCTNNKARKRYIVMHTADYVPSVKDPNYKSKIGNSEGCITLPELRKDMLKKCQKGALVYAHY